MRSPNNTVIQIAIAAMLLVSGAAVSPAVAQSEGPGGEGQGTPSSSVVDDRIRMLETEWQIAWNSASQSNDSQLTQWLSQASRAIEAARAAAAEGQIALARNYLRSAERLLRDVREGLRRTGAPVPASRPIRRCSRPSRRLAGCAWKARTRIA